MTCVMPPQLKDRDLLAYVDGEASDEVTAHVQRCPHCRERARDLARKEMRLRAQLYRAGCPSPHELGEYQLDLLVDERRQSIEHHVAQCQHCARELARLEEYLHDLAPDLERRVLDQVRDRTRILIARLGEAWKGLAAPTPTLAPAYSGVRGEQGEPQLYEADEVQVIVECQPDSEQPDQVVLLGLVTGVDPSEMEAHLWRAGQRVATVALDALGNVVVPGLVPGTYDLILAGPEVEVHVQALDVNSG
jgi:anti-sigma factor RsiW